MGVGGDVQADLVEVHLHGVRVGAGQHKASADAALRADCAEQIGVGVSLVSRQGRPGSFRRPDARTAVLLPNTRFILEPDFNARPLRLWQMAYVGIERAGEVFLNAA